VELLEHALAPVLDLVLRLARAQRFGQVMPEPEEPRVEHLEDAADITRARLVEVQRSGGSVEVLRRRTIALAIEELHRDERIEEFGDRARMDLELTAQLGAGHAPRAEAREEAELDGGEQDLRGPEGERGLEDRAGIDGRCG